MLRLQSTEIRYLPVQTVDRINQQHCPPNGRIWVNHSVVGVLNN